MMIFNYTFNLINLFFIDMDNTLKNKDNNQKQINVLMMTQFPSKNPYINLLKSQLECRGVNISFQGYYQRSLILPIFNELVKKKYPMI